MEQIQLVRKSASFERREFEKTAYPKGFSRTGSGSGSVAFRRGSLGFQSLFDDGDEHVDRDGDPDLRLHGVLGCAEELLDPQMLLDPFEEQLDLPAASIQLRDVKAGKAKLLVRNTSVLPVFGIVELDAAQRRRKPGGNRSRSTQSSGRRSAPLTVDRMRIATLAFRFDFAACDKKAARVVQAETAARNRDSRDP